MDSIDNAKEKNIRSRQSKKRLLLLLASFLVIIASTVAWQVYSHRYIHGKITFQEYAPTYWPSNGGIKDKTIWAVYTPAGSPPQYTELAIEMSDGSMIYERERKKDQLIYTCPFADTANEKCSVGHTSNGEPYLLFTTTYDNGELDQVIEWSRRDTDIRIDFENIPDKGYAEENFEKIIEALKPVDYKGLDVDYIDHSVI